MFGFGEKKKVPPGAEEKYRVAEKMRELSRAEMQSRTDGGSGGIHGSQTIPIAVIFGLAVGFALFITEGSSINMSGLHLTGNAAVDGLLFGSGVPHFTGDADMDKLVVVFIRGMALFVMMGAAPFLAYLFCKSVGKNKVSPFVACWGATVFLPIAYFALDAALGLF